MLPLEPLPWETPALAGKPWAFVHEWKLWWDSLRAGFSRVASQDGSYSGEDLAASLATETVVTTARAGVYRVLTHVRITQAASVGSSLQVTVRWTADGVAQARVGTTITDGGPTSQIADLFLLDADQGTPITVETSYVSAGATAMQYRLSVSVESI
jgi:hypothetical protein